MTLPTNPLRDRHDILRQRGQLVFRPEVLEHRLESGDDEHEQNGENAEEDDDDDRSGRPSLRALGGRSFMAFSM